MKNGAATQEERENCQGDRAQLHKNSRSFLFVAMVTAGPVFPMWAVGHLFWRVHMLTHSQEELRVEAYIRRAMPEYANYMETTQSL